MPKLFAMRTLLIGLLLIPIISGAQINRSAMQLAQENIREYLGRKLFIGQPYKPVSYGILKEYKVENNKEIAWNLTHSFEITEVRQYDEQKTAIQKPYKFVFLLGRKMEVLRAEAAYLD
jgi:hypothetical protein